MVSWIKRMIMILILVFSAILHIIINFSPNQANKMGENNDKTAYKVQNKRHSQIDI